MEGYPEDLVDIQNDNMQFMIAYDPLEALILHSKVILADDLDMSTDTHCSFNVLLLAITVVCIRRDVNAR
jgi:hypothetical protein